MAVRHIALLMVHCRDIRFAPGRGPGPRDGGSDRVNEFIYLQRVLWLIKRFCSFCILHLGDEGARVVRFSPGMVQTDGSELVDAYINLPRTLKVIKRFCSSVG